MSIEFVPSLPVSEVRRHAKDAIVRSQNIAVLGPSGGGKTTTMVELAETVTATDLKDHPRGCDGVVVYVLDCAMYDEITIRGVLIAGDNYVDPVTGVTRVASDLAAPLWYTECMQLLNDNPTKHLLIVLDEINLGIPPFQAVLIKIIDNYGIGANMFPRDDRQRISFAAAGNRPEDLPAANYLTGPLAQRMSKWVKVEPCAEDVIEYLSERAELAPEVEKFLTEYPQCTCVPGLTATGRVPYMNVLDNDANDDDTEFLTPVVNGLHPRKWHEVSLELIHQRHFNPEATGRAKREALSAMVPPAIAQSLMSNAELADTFATMDDVVAGPEAATIPVSALLQSMQVRMLMPKLCAENVRPFITYVKRMPDAAASGVVAFVVKSHNAKSQAVSRGGRKLTLSPDARAALISAFMPQYSRAIARAHGEVVAGDEQVTTDTRSLAAPAVVPAAPTEYKTAEPVKTPPMADLF
jgi:hypothetical protein